MQTIQTIANTICCELKIPTIIIKQEDKQGDKKWLGSFYPDKLLITLRNLTDLETLSHELAHYYKYLVNQGIKGGMHDNQFTNCLYRIEFIVAFNSKLQYLD